MKKRILAWIICLSLFLTIVPASAINSFAESLSGVKTIDNGYIRVYVSEENGGFSVSSAEGDRLKKSDNNKKLLYHDGEYDTSFISLKIGEGSEAKEYLFGGKYDTSEPLKVTQAKENGEIKAEWAVNNIRFTQVISLAADASNEHGMVSLSLFAENNGEEKKIRTRVLLDTYLGNSDFGYYMLSDENSNVTAVSSERVVESYGGLSLQSFYASDSLADPSVEAYSVNATIPYKAAFAHWNNLAASLFEFEADETVSFISTRNEYLTSDSAYAMYFDMGKVGPGKSGSLTTYYGVYSHSKVSNSESVAIDVTAPVMLNLTPDRSDYERLTGEGEADFTLGVNFTNYKSDGAKDLNNIVLAVRSTENLMPLGDGGAALPGFDFDTAEAMTVPYTDVKVGDTVSKTLYFKAKSVADAAYERITVGVYDVSKANGQITEEGRLGEKRVYVLLPGNDGNLPKVTFPSVSPEIIYSSGTRHLYAAVTNSAMLDDAANWNIFAESDAHGKKIAIPHGNISIKDGVMDIAITDNEDISGLGDWRIVFEWTDAAVSAGIVGRDGKKVTSKNMRFTVSDELKYKNDSYGILSVVETGKNTYEILTFKTERDFETYKDSGSYKEILLTFRGEFTKMKKVNTGTGEEIGTYYTAVSKKTLDPETRAYSVDNRVTVNDCLDFEGGTVSVYYENYLDAAKFGSTAICTEFDGELYTSDARTGVYKGKAIFTKIEQGEPVSLIPYDENGARVDEENFTDGTISLIWNSAAGIGQTLAGMVFKLAYGQMGTMKVEVEKTEKIGDQIKRIKETKNCGVVSFSASLDLSFTGAAGDPNAEGTKRDTYWSKAKDIWQYYREDQSLYQYTYNAGRINQLRDFSKIDEHTEFDDGSKKVNASVMVPDVLFGCGEGFVGVHFKVNVGLKNFVSSLPSIQGEIEVNTINDWSFGVSGEVELATFTLEAKVSFKSHDDIPVPDELYVFVGGFKPGINIDGFGVVWITGAGGGVKNLYDTIFLSQGVPPLKLLLSTSFSIVQVLSCKKATLAVGLTGISLNAEDITVMDIPALTVINKMGLSAEWYPGLDLRANIVVNLFEGVIYGGGYIVLVSPDYNDVFFEMFARAKVAVPGSVPIVGGMTVASVDLGINSEKVWGALEVLFIKLGVTYYWGEGSVDFGSGTKTEPTYPELLGYDDVPVYYDSERGRTLYARVGTNTGIMATNLESEGSLTLLSTGASVKSDAEKKNHEINMGMYSPSSEAAIVQIEFDAESEEDAKSKAALITVGSTAGANDYGLLLYSGDNIDKANANLTFSESSGKATYAFTVTDKAKYDMTWHAVTPAGADIVLYNVYMPPEVTDVSGKITGLEIKIDYDGKYLFDLDSLSFYLTEDADDVGYPVAVTDDYNKIDLGTLTAKLPSEIPTGDYYIRAVYSREDVVNGAAVSKTKIHVENKNTPDAATILSAAPAGNLMFALKLGDAPVTGYKVTVYNEDMTLTELSDMDFKKKDGNLITVGGSYSAAAEDGSEVTAGLSGGRSYYIGVTPYNEADGSAVYGKEVLSEKLFLPEMTTPTVDITADKEKKTRTEEVITESGRSLSETLVFTENDVTFTAAISEKASGTWRLDSGGETEFINSDSVKIALSEITEGKHSLTVKGKDLEGDGFIATYVFTVDTLSPRLLTKSPVNGAMYKDGAIEFSGVTDSEAIFTVKCDGVTVIDGVPVSEMGSFDPSTGVFSADLEIPDPDGEMRKTLEIRVSDDVGNSETRKVALTNGALSEIRSIALTFDGATVGGNIKSTEAVSGKIGAVAVMNDGTIIKLNNDNLDFSFTAVSGEAELTDGGEFTASKGAQGIITARFAATDSAFYSSSACFGAENNGFTGTVSVSSTVGGRVTGAGQFAPGDRVTLTATANKGYRFEKWGVTGVDAIISGNTLSFDMPRENVTVKATFSPITGGNTGGTGSGAGTGGGENKKASLSASAGEKVRAKLPAGVSASGYLPYYSDVDLNKTFVPVSAVTDGYVVFIAPVSATYYFGQNRKTFVDISGHWGESYIDFAAERDILKGVGENLFDPDGTMTRAMFTTVLYRLSGSPEVKNAPSFTDVPAGSWYYDAIGWASENGIIAGFGDGTARPDNEVTREEMCALTERFIKFSGYEIASGEEKSFLDSGEISDWAKSAVSYCSSRGIILGRENGAFAPHDNATRAENAALIKRFIEKILA